MFRSPGETAGMCSREFFAKCRKESYFINTSRGELVDDESAAGSPGEWKPLPWPMPGYAGS
ncbi:MAG: NAD(P)-dependent oxidoreductase [Clostridium sp.]